MCLRCAKGTSIEPRIKRMGCDAPSHLSLFTLTLTLSRQGRGDTPTPHRASRVFATLRVPLDYCEY